MSERLQESHEQFKPVEQSAETHRPLREVSVEHEKQKQHEKLINAEKAVEHHAKTKESTHVEKDSHKHEQPLYVNNELKRIALDRTLARVRRHLSKPNKALSKVIHQPAVQAVSEVGSKTIARPSSLLLGAFFALVGNSVLFYMAKHYGFTYNYLLFFVFFAAGFALALVIDAVLWLLRRGRVNT